MLPPFEGDDLRRLAQEVTTARSLLWQAQSLRYATQTPPTVCGCHPPTLGMHPVPRAPALLLSTEHGEPHSFIPVHQVPTPEEKLCGTKGVLM